MLTGKKYIEKQVQDWVNHVEDSEQYHNELVTNKVSYLVRNLQVFNITHKAAMKLLVEIESRQTETDSEQITERQIQDERMEDGIDVADNSNHEGNLQDDNEKIVDMFDDEHSSVSKIRCTAF